VRALLTVRDFNDAKYVVMVTRAGKIKKTELTAFSNVRANGIIAIDINEGDDLYAVRLSQGDDEIFIGTHDGMAIRFNENGVRPMGRGQQASGIPAKATVVEMDAAGVGRSGPELPAEGEEPAPLAERSRRKAREITPDERDGYHHREGLRTPVPVRFQSRGGIGVTNIKTTDKNGKVAGICTSSKTTRCCSSPSRDDHPHERRRHPLDRTEHARRPRDQHRRNDLVVAAVNWSTKTTRSRHRAGPEAGDETGGEAPEDDTIH
jgi:DNA gyrase/topoisomerase IV subunit A